MAAVVRDPAFARSLSQSLLDRLLHWMLNVVLRCLDAAAHLPSARTIAVVVLSLAGVALGVRVGMDWFAGRARTRRRFTRDSDASHDPWRDFDQLRARGDHEAAAHMLYRAVLLELSVRDRIRLDRSRTSGDYLRELRRGDLASYAPFGVFARRFEAVVYGHGPCNEDALEELRALAMSVAARDIRAA